MTTPGGPRRRRPSRDTIRRRIRYLSQWIPPELAARMAPTTPIRARRTQAIVRAMRVRVRARYEELLSESEMNDRGENIHPYLGVIDWEQAVYDTTMRIERAIYTGDEEYGDIEPELHAIFSP